MANSNLAAPALAAPALVYFRHEVCDSAARRLLFARTGVAGYGVYWRVREALAGAVVGGAGARYEASRLAAMLGLEEALVDRVVTIALDEGLFVVDSGGRLRSPEDDRLKGEVERRRRRGQKAAAARWGTPIGRNGHAQGQIDPDVRIRRS